MTRRYTKGFSIVEVIIIVVVLGLIGFVGYTFYNNWQAAQNDNSSQTADTTTPEAPEITSTKDLDTASETLDQASLDSSELDALDQELSSI